MKYNIDKENTNEMKTKYHDMVAKNLCMNIYEAIMWVGGSIRLSLLLLMREPS